MCQGSAAVKLITRAPAMQLPENLRKPPSKTVQHQESIMLWLESGLAIE
jgi:hypothetical protein